MLSLLEKKLIANHTQKIKMYHPKNVRKELYYEAKDPRANSLFGLQGKEKELRVAVSWAEVVVEVLNERINLAAVEGPPELNLQKFFRDNQLKILSRRAHRDAFIFGTSYILTLDGDVEEGEPDVLITIENPKYSFGEVNPRTGRLKTFMKIVPSGGTFGEDVAFLMLPNETIYFRILEKEWEELSREVHNRRTVTCEKLVNQSRGTRPGGQSEITTSVESNIDAANDALTDMRIASKTYATPHRYLLNVDPKAFQDADGNAKDIDAYMDKLWVINGAGGKDGKTPVAGQFSPSSPEPFLEMVKGFALQVATEKGIPESFFGYHGNQPSSADAIKVMLTRLEDRAKDKIADFEPSWLNVFRHALLVRDGFVPENFDEVRLIWRDTAVRTPAATADAVSKYIAAKIFAADSPTIMRMIGISEEEIFANKAAAERAARMNTLATIAEAASIARGSAPVILAASEINNATEAQA